MRYNKPVSPGTMLLVIVLALGLLPSVMAGRRANKRVLEAQLGSRFLVELPGDMKAGRTAEAVIVDPGKLAKFGLVNLKKGEKIRLIKEAGDSDFTVEVTQKVSLTIDAKGALRKVGK